MPLTSAFVDGHIATWTRNLGSTNRPYRKHWPSHLFRHESVENAARILKSGYLLSRSDAEGIEHEDIAPSDVIGRRKDAHEYARLYFRPRNPTQYRIEGVRKAAERQEGWANAHAPAMVMFLFDAKAVLSLPEVCFSDGNMQADQAALGDDEVFFRRICFTNVYHDGPHSQDPAGWEIRRAKCAEVLPVSPLALEGSIKGVLCRSPAERQHLLYLLADEALVWQRRIRVYSMPGVFSGQMAFVDTVAVTGDGVTVKLHPRADNKDVEMSIAILTKAGQQLASRGPRMVQANRPWLFRFHLATGSYIVQVYLEGALAHEGLYLIEDLPF